MENLQIFSICLEGVVGLVVSFLVWKIKKIREVEEELKQREKHFERMEMLNTRMNLIRECNHYIEKGFAPVYARATVIELYSAYHSVGGNGGIESLVEEFTRLPTNEVKK